VTEEGIAVTRPAVVVVLMVVVGCAAGSAWRWLSPGPPYDSVL
jgi:hypothetical protein